ncbi:hypothetical protein AMS68_003157 [Peltaster fructicola]|uniref:J domain-containing protein n=1 Tax=Peltaster fructicola TaxID=286661 RepID=A0A6H0XT53_9PEZI|nr:hypothetical protein AMS68_003157 [Peltaster fructicola]
MPKAYDIKRNYCMLHSAHSAYPVTNASADADLELPTNASIDDIKKQYRRLAKIWHPDRNAGKEEECVPRFQAIQAAHEILSDPVNKAQYDADRRVAGPFKSAAPSAPNPPPRGNPYQATSNFPPPPRRTQPGQWQRTQFQRPPANGAERFSNFAGANVQPPKRSDATQDRANAFYRAQQAQKTQERQQQREAQAAGSGPSTPNAPPRRPAPPPRGDTNWPSEEKIRPTFKHNDTAFDSEAESRRSAWHAFKGTGGGSTPEPGIRRSNTARTPKKQGFDPNAPGSDERPATGHYVHRHKSEDFGQPFDRPEGAAGPSHRRPHIDPTDPHRRYPLPDDVPFSEGERKRTPYTSFVGEKTDVSSNMRRSRSTRDTSKLDSPHSPLRPNSTSPLSGTPGRKGPTFEFPSAESDVSSQAGSSPENYESPFAMPPPLHNPAERVKKVPSPPSKRFAGSQAPFSPPKSNDTDESKKDNIFNFGNAPPFSPPPLPTGKSRSEESINTKFAQDFNGTFAGTTENTQSRPTSRKSTTNFARQNSRSRAAPAFGQPSPLGTAFATSDLPPPPTSAPNSANQARTFSPEDWQKHFADGSWVVPPPPPGGPKVTSPTAQESVSPTNVKARDSAFSTGDDRMDIDDVPPSHAVNDRHAMPPPPKPPRPVQVPQSQWHQQQTARTQTNVKTNLDDLSQVEPLTRERGAGLESLNHLSADLPFKSQASQSVPASPVDLQSPRMPAVPAPPHAPTTVTKQTWTQYAAEFGMYLAAFHDFNGRLLLHFNTRQTAVKMKMDKGMDWLQATGDVVTATGGPSGFTAYARQTEQDAKLREGWNLACDKHVIAVQQFEEFRERVRRAATGGGLPDR